MVIRQVGGLDGRDPVEMQKFEVADLRFAKGELDTLVGLTEALNLFVCDGHIGNSSSRTARRKVSISRPLEDQEFTRRSAFSAAPPRLVVG